MKGTKVEKGTPATKGTPAEIVEHLSTRHWDTLRKGAEKQADRIIGEHVLLVLKSGAALGLETLLSSLRAEIDQSPSATGKIAAEHDTGRVALEVALTKILQCSARALE